MARVCELSGKKVMTGNNVSHAKNRTKRKFLPNLNNVSLVSEKLDLTIKLDCKGRKIQLWLVFASRMPIFITIYV